jgi:ABC-type lipoprotein export system ATPase subunit
MFCDIQRFCDLRGGERNRQYQRSRKLRGASEKTAFKRKTGNRQHALFSHQGSADQDPVFKDIFYYEILPELREQGRLVIVISHDDRYFSVADKIISLERGAAARVTTMARHERLSM